MLYATVTPCCESMAASMLAAVLSDAVSAPGADSDASAVSANSKNLRDSAKSGARSLGASRPARRRATTPRLQSWRQARQQ